MKHLFLLFPIIIPGVGTAAAAENALTLSEGARLAQTVCAECHAVGIDADAHSPNQSAPRFMDIAAMPSTTALSIKVFLRSSHRDMPNLMLDEKETEAISGYILDLRNK